MIGDPVGVPIQAFHDGWKHFRRLRDLLTDFLPHLELHARAGRKLIEVVLAANPADEFTAGEDNDAVVRAAARAAADALLDALSQQRVNCGVGDNVHAVEVVVRRALRQAIHDEKAAGIAC